ncbi:MAG: nitroreductase family protein [Candidatus Aureabacteria bacterium]|nr:nitroreductase family protein [Candidatus Auribacterota bacterium]
MLLDVFDKRRSVRKYSDKTVEREKIIACLEAARLAPSACNSQPWRFIVMDEPSVRERACVAALRGIVGINAFLRDAPVIIAILSRRKIYLDILGKYFRKTDYCLTDIGIAGEHLCLQAAHLGLGTCWVGWFNGRELKKALGLGKLVKIEYLITIGYPADAGSPADRKKLNEIASWNKDGFK